MALESVDITVAVHNAIDSFDQPKFQGIMRAFSRYAHKVDSKKELKLIRSTLYRWQLYVSSKKKVTKERQELEWFAYARGVILAIQILVRAFLRIAQSSA